MRKNIRSNSVVSHSIYANVKGDEKDSRACIDRQSEDRGRIRGRCGGRKARPGNARDRDRSRRGGRCRICEVEISTKVRRAKNVTEVVQVEEP